MRPLRLDETSAADCDLRSPRPGSGRPRDPPSSAPRAAQFVFVETMPGMLACSFGIGVSNGNGLFWSLPALPGQRVGQWELSFSMRRRAECGVLRPAISEPGGREGQSTSATHVSSSRQPPISCRHSNCRRHNWCWLAVKKICPITRLPLGSMGELVETEVDERPVYLCCEGVGLSRGNRQDSFGTGREIRRRSLSPSHSILNRSLPGRFAAAG